MDHGSLRVPHLQKNWVGQGRFPIVKPMDCLIPLLTGIEIRCGSLRNTGKDANTEYKK
jgi:hypothetical protein